VIPQNPKIKAKIINYLSQKGCSVSALNLLIRNPIDFYNQYVLGLKESETILDEVSHAELGTLFHNVLEDLYKPFVATKLTSDTFKEIKKRRNDVIENRIEELNKKLSPPMSILNLYKNICSVWIDKFLQFDLSRINAGRDIVLKDLEERCEIEIKLQLEENFATIKLVGSIDRVEEENGVIRLIDYKTGKVEQKDLRIDDFSEVMDNLDLSKANQLLYYTLLYSHISKFKKIESAIYSCRNNLTGILPLMIQGKSFVDNDDLIAYTVAVKIKLESILKSDFQFEESNEFKSKFTDLMV
jgi:ATP-dependent helicase/DNAse subunit B